MAKCRCIGNSAGIWSSLLPPFWILLSLGILSVITVDLTSRDNEFSFAPCLKKSPLYLEVSDVPEVKMGQR